MAEKVREEIAEKIYHFVHRGHVNYFSWKELPEKYGKGAYRELANQILSLLGEWKDAEIAELKEQIDYMHEAYEVMVEFTEQGKQKAIRRNRSWLANMTGWRNPEQIEEIKQQAVRKVFEKLGRTLRIKPFGEEPREVWLYEDEWQALKAELLGESEQ